MLLFTVTPDNDNENENKSDKLEDKSTEIPKSSSEDIWSARTVGSSNESRMEVKESCPSKSGIDSSSTSSSSSSSSSNCTHQKSSKGIMSPPKFVPLGTPSRNTEER